MKKTAFFLLVFCSFLTALEAKIQSNGPSQPAQSAPKSEGVRGVRIVMLFEVPQRPREGHRSLTETQRNLMADALHVQEVEEAARRIEAEDFLGGTGFGRSWLNNRNGIF